VFKLVFKKGMVVRYLIKNLMMMTRCYLYLKIIGNLFLTISINCTLIKMMHVIHIYPNS